MHPAIYTVAPTLALLTLKVASVIRTERIQLSSGTATAQFIGSIRGQ